MNESNQLDQLILQYPKLAVSILDGAFDAMAERLLPNNPRVCRKVWYDGESQEWEGDFVETLCMHIYREIVRRCSDIVPDEWPSDSLQSDSDTDETP